MIDPVNSDSCVSWLVRLYLQTPTSLNSTLLLYHVHATMGFFFYRSAVIGPRNGLGLSVPGLCTPRPLVQ